MATLEQSGFVIEEVSVKSNPSWCLTKDGESVSSNPVNWGIFHTYAEASTAFYNNKKIVDVRDKFRIRKFSKVVSYFLGDYVEL